MTTLPQEEYIEQAYLFRILCERIQEQVPMQELLEQTKHEILATTKLPMAIEFMLTELKHSGVMGPAMRRMSHYFSTFQTYLIDEAEAERGRFDIRAALKILHAEAQYRARPGSPQGYFFFHFETLSRNRLRYDPGITAMSEDPVYDADWRDWLLILRRQVGFIDLADLIFVRSQEYFVRRQGEIGLEVPEAPILFGVKEGRVAMANRGKDPLYLFAAMQRHLGYPEVPRPHVQDQTTDQVPLLMRKLERLDLRIKLLEQEQRDGIDITKFYHKQLPIQHPELEEPS